MSASDLSVVPSTVRRGHCRYCRQPIIWATVARTEHRRAGFLPFDTRPDDPRIETTDTGITFQLWPKDAVHNCRARKAEVGGRQKTKHRLHEASRTGQGRMF